jgi:hypothetical protein
MAVIITAAQKTAAFLTASSDLKFLLDREGVDEDFQAKLYHVGVANVKQFAAFAKDRADLKKITRESFEIDADADIQSRVKVSRIVVAWDVAKARSAKQAEIEGESQCRRVPKDIGASDFQAMREAFETRWWELEDRRVPGKSYMEKKLDEVEKNELKAELLSEVVSQEEDDPDTLKTVWSTGGELKAVKVGAKVSLPTNPEELRSRITLLGTAWIFVSSQQTHRPYLQDLNPRLFQEYLDYFLGDFVYGLCGRDGRGEPLASPSWSLVISYEHAVRSKAMSLVRKGSTFADALRASWEDPLIKERFLNTPLALESLKRPFSSMGSDRQEQRAPAKGKGKGKNQGQGKGKNKAGMTDCKAVTPDGRKICYRYNSKVRCDNKKCPFTHVCGKCFEKHPMYECGKAGNHAALGL